MRTKYNITTYFLYPIFVLCVVATLPLWIYLVASQFATDILIVRNKKEYEKKQVAERIYARKCELRPVQTKREAADFLKRNHMFG